MAERKRMTNVLSRLRPSPEAAPVAPPSPAAPAGKTRLFDLLNATSPLDAEPDLAKIAHEVATFATVEDGEKPLSGPTERSDQKGRSDQAVGPESPPERSARTVNAVRPDGLTKRSDLMDRPDGRTVFLGLEKPIARTAQQRATFGYLAAHPNIITSIANLSEILSIPPTTLRKILDTFARAGLLKKARIGNDGLKILFDTKKRSDQTVGPHGQTERSDQNPSKKDRKESSLSISLEALRLTWPALAQTGFGPEQLEQIEANLSATGQTTERVLPSLQHAEWELANGKMLDKDGNPVADPCAWVFRSLAQTGYYRRPKGYVSPEEQALKDQEEEARALAAARQRAQQAQFEAWRDGLNAEQLKEAMQGHPGGPKDAWLKRVWREKGATERARPDAT